MIDAVLQRLSDLHPKVIDLSLDRVLSLLDRMGNPQHRLPPVVHVAGTNGKGSTVATLRALLEAAGLVVHVYTSPHLVRFAERIRIAGQIPSDHHMLQLLERVEQMNDCHPITFFEITTAAAFLAFSETPADVVILETGLGGRLDATNVVNKPALTILTPIAMDHEAFLGDSLPVIAGEKAGILKMGVPCVVAEQQPPAMAVIRQRAAELGASLVLAGVDFTATLTEQGMRYNDLELPRSALPGDFQLGNAALALAAVDCLTKAGHIPRLSEEQKAQGLRTIDWPARLQRLSRGPLVDMLPQGWEIWLDGGHNPHAAQALASHFPQWADRPLVAVFAMLSNKDCGGYLTPLAPFFHAMATVAIPGEAASLTAEQAAECARTHGVKQVSAQQDLPSALHHVLGLVSQPARILVCGSLYLAGHVLADNG